MSDKVQETTWKFDKHISLGHVITTLTIFISIVSWGYKLDSRIEQNSITIKYLQREQEAQRPRVDALRLELKGDLKRINDKLDRIMERSIK